MAGKSKGKTVGKWVGISAVALLVAAALSGGSNSSQNSGTDSAASKQVSSRTDSAVVASNNVTSSGSTKSSDSERYTVGSTIEKSGLKITINSADLNFNDYDNPYGWYSPSDGMRYIKVSFTFENTSNSDKYVSIYDFDCYADNVTCQQKYGLDDSSFINTNLSSGRNISFCTYYEVPVTAGSIELEYETSWLTSKKATIKLQ